jgi:hypothetical protein
MAITTVAYHFVTSEERRHTLQIGVSICLHGRRVLGQVALPCVIYGRVLMAVRQQSVQFANIVVIQFQFQYTWRGNEP